VRLALVRLRLSMREYLGELPPATEQVFADVMKADAQAPARIFIPTRPTMLARGETVRVQIVVTPDAPEVALRTRVGGGEWIAVPAKLAARRTYQAVLGPFDSGEIVEYAAAAGKLTSPTYAVTLI
jgi:hypothetical protein